MLASNTRNKAREELELPRKAISGSYILLATNGIIRDQASNCEAADSN